MGIRFSSLRLPDCVSGILGHLHHELSDSHYTQIGRLDVVMVPTDGGLTMGADSMSRVVQRLRSSLILPIAQKRSAT